MRYIYVEYLGKENGEKQHLVYDKITRKEVVITQSQLVDDGIDQFSWGKTFSKMKGGSHA